MANHSKRSTIIILATTMLITCAWITPAITASQKEMQRIPPSVTLSTIAGQTGIRGNAEDGNGANARFWNPTKMVFDGRNNMLYVADGTVIRSIDRDNNVKTYMPLHTLGNHNEIMDIDLAPGSKGGTLIFITSENDIWKIEPDGNSSKATRLIDRVYGGNRLGEMNSADQIDGPTGIVSGKNGEIYYFNSFWNTMRKINLNPSSPLTGTVEPFVGKPLPSKNDSVWPFADGKGEVATFCGSVSDISSDANGNIYVADFRNDLVRMVTPAGTVTSLFQYKEGLGFDKDGPVSVAQSNRVTQVSASADGKTVFFTSFGKGGYNTPTLRMVRPGQEVITLIASLKRTGNDTGTGTGLGMIGGIASTSDGKTVFISEPGNKVIRKVTIQ